MGLTKVYITTVSNSRGRVRLRFFYHYISLINVKCLHKCTALNCFFQNFNLSYLKNKNVTTYLFIRIAYRISEFSIPTYIYILIILYAFYFYTQSTSQTIMLRSHNGYVMSAQSLNLYFHNYDIVINCNILFKRIQITKLTKSLNSYKIHITFGRYVFYVSVTLHKHTQL